MTFSFNLCTAPLLVTQIAYFKSRFRLELGGLKGGKPPKDGKIYHH